MDAALGLQVAVCRPTVYPHGHALDPGLLALGLVENLRAEAVALGPAQVHAQEHRGPVGGFGAARAGADRQQGTTLVVFAPEQQLAADLQVVGRQPVGLVGDPGQHLRVLVADREIEQLDR